MRFGSIKAFLNFIAWIEGMGYNCLSPLYDVEKEVKALPGFISQYYCDIQPLLTGIEIVLIKNKTPKWSIYLKDRSLIELDEEPPYEETPRKCS